MKILRWIVAFPIILICVVFAVANREMVRFELWPLPFSADLPLYLAVLGTFVIGLIVGLAFAYMAGHSKRVMARQEHRRAVMLDHENAGLRAQLESAKAAASAVPALPAAPAPGTALANAAPPLLPPAA